MNKKARIAVFGFFFLSGFVLGLWAAGLPSLSERLHLGPGRLGSVLLLISGGALVSMLIAGPLVDRWSSRRMCWIGGPLSAVVLLGPALAPSYWSLAALAVLFGIGVGVTEVAMNAHSVEVERAYGRPIISAFHGTWSLGGAAAGAITAGTLRLGLDPQALLIAAALVVPFGYLAAARWLLPEPPQYPESMLVHSAQSTPPEPVAGTPSGRTASATPSDRFATPALDTAPGASTAAGVSRQAVGDVSEGYGGSASSGRSSGGAVSQQQAVLERPVRRVPLGVGLIALLGVAAFAGHLSEGAAIDWTSLHARWILGADPALAPLAYTVFSVAMTTVRLLGDPIRARLGPVRTIQLAGILATAGYVLVLAAPATGASLRLPVAWVGWALAGVGLAPVVPVIFSAVGAAGGPVGRALSLVTAFGYSGLLIGPAVLGYVAESASLPTALIIPALLAAVVALSGTPAIRRATTHPHQPTT
ncbi:MFS transporter [Nonomuraea sediminis]|uniref:MFS transporter n=1 Tax=Nonomuraea sediminis TaxID=2835864 RepID=UPI0027DFBA53|nr:MFS transporter [Nonomuraea sediminis]